MSDERGPRERAYDEHISPLMAKIIALCKEHGIPMVASYELDCPEDNPDVPLMCTTVLIDGEGGPLEPRANSLVNAAAALRPAPAYAHAETIVTDPATGRTTISIRRVS